jgi:hypothetical protein
LTSLHTVLGLVPLLAVNPAAQVQVWLPLVFPQVACASHPPLLTRHSSTSLHTVLGLVPLLAVKPAAQVQVWLPLVLPQVACASQPPLLTRHSFTSTQPVPVDMPSPE